MESISDILEELRGIATGCEIELYIQFPLPTVRGEPFPQYVENLADRIEAAYKHEVVVSKTETTTKENLVVAEADMKTLSGLVGDIAIPKGEKVTAPWITKEGNVAKMREALEQIRYSFYIDPDDNKCHSDIDESDLREICNAALTEPPRNCDVGTAKEQAKRFFVFCDSNKCPSCPCRFTTKTDCALIWSQMPYEEGGAK